MKHKLILVGMLGFAVLFGCSQVSYEVKAELPSGFTLTTVDRINQAEIYKIKDKVTGCYYIVGVSNSSSYTSASSTQMFIEKNGVAVPYCEEVK